MEYTEAVRIVSELFRINQWANNKSVKKCAIRDNNIEIHRTILVMKSMIWKASLDYKKNLKSQRPVL
jgi:hypothetical protein